MSSLQPFLSCIDHAEFGISLQQLSEAEITAASRMNPFAPNVRLATILSEYSIQECYLPVLPPHHNSAAEPMFADDVRIAVPRSWLEYISERDDALANVRDEVAVLDSDTPPLGLLKTDNRAMALAFDDNEKPHAMLEGSSDCFYSWVDVRLSDLFNTG